MNACNSVLSLMASSLQLKGHENKNLPGLPYQNLIEGFMYLTIAICPISVMQLVL